MQYPTLEGAVHTLGVVVLYLHLFFVAMFSGPILFAAVGTVFNYACKTSTVHVPFIQLPYVEVHEYPGLRNAG